MVANFVGAKSTSLHYAACGGNAQCCKSWCKNCLEEILSTQPNDQLQVRPSPHLSLPLMSIVKIARECEWKNGDSLPSCQDPCVVCPERKCMVAADGCGHEFCTRCALYLCPTNTTSTVAKGPPGSISCPLCRYGMVSFVKLPGTESTGKAVSKTSLCLPYRPATTPLCKPGIHCSRISPFGSCCRSLNCQTLPSMKINSSSLCIGAPDGSPLVPGTVDRSMHNHVVRCSSRSGFRRSTSSTEGRKTRFSALDQCVTTGSGR